MQAKVPILTYHSIDNSGSVISMASEQFRFQMETLKNRNFHVISLKELVDSMRGKQPLDHKTVVITFDDGFNNFYTSAYPVLKEFGYGATVFLVAGYIGKTSLWNKGRIGLPVLDLLAWEKVKELSENGIDFGAHTVSHHDLSILPLEQTVQEIYESKEIIQNKIEKEVNFFCYPYGKVDDQIKAIAQKEFYGACSTKMDFVTPKSDIYDLPRIDMYYFSENSFFRLIGNYGFSLYVILRKAMRYAKNEVKQKKDTKYISLNE